MSSVFYESFPAKIARIVFAIFFVYYLRPYALEFKSYCHQLAHGMSNPSIVFKVSRTRRPAAGLTSRRPTRTTGRLWWSTTTWR